MEQQNNIPQTPTPAVNPGPTGPIIKKNFWAFLKNKKFWFIAGPVVLVIAGGLTWYFVSHKNTKTEATITPTESTVTPGSLVASLLNGVMVSSNIATQRPVATMIENSPDARPQVGLTSADMVYEGVVEGGITRFMALFQQSLPTKVGPVRSARSNYIDWLSEFDAVYMHAGGSPTALGRIGEYKIKDYPDSTDGTYWREPKAGVASEHTLFANVAKVFENSVKNKKWPSSSSYTSWIFKDVSGSSSAAASTITVNFSTQTYQASWAFDPVTNTYARSLAGTPHRDRVSNEQIKASDVVVMTVQRSANPPYSGTGKESEWTMTTIGSGAASIFRDGTRIDGTWKKPSRLERTKFYDASGAEVTFNRGKIWLEVIPQTGSVTVK